MTLTAATVRPKKRHVQYSAVVSKKEFEKAEHSPET
jgi:hypothetical protein